MFFSTNIRFSYTKYPLERHERTYLHTVDDMQKECVCVMRISSNAQRTFSSHLRIHAMSVCFIILFIHRPFDFIFHAHCVWTVDEKERTSKKKCVRRNRFRWDLSLNIFQRVEHKPINVFHAFFRQWSGLLMKKTHRICHPIERGNREAAEKHRIKCFFSLAMKIYSKSLCVDDSMPMVSVVDTQLSARIDCIV